MFEYAPMRMRFRHLRLAMCCQQTAGAGHGSHLDAFTTATWMQRESPRLLGLMNTCASAVGIEPEPLGLSVQISAWARRNVVPRSRLLQLMKFRPCNERIKARRV